MKEISSNIYHPSIPVSCHPNFVNRIGKRYGNLTVMEFSGYNKKRQANWICKCDCGNRLVVFGGNLHSKHTTSCGCARIDSITKHKEGGKNQIKGGRSAEYQALCGILQRCFNKNHASFNDYGGRGVRSHWLTSKEFEGFLKCVGRRPTPKHSIDRHPDKNGNYEPGNIRWATAEQQQGNTRKNRYVTYDGDTLCVRAMARKYNKDPITFGYRIKNGWDIHRAITTPCGPYKCRNASI